MSPSNWVSDFQLFRNKLIIWDVSFIKKKNHLIFVFIQRLRANLSSSSLKSYKNGGNQQEYAAFADEFKGKRWFAVERGWIHQ